MKYWLLAVCALVATSQAQDLLSDKVGSFCDALPVCPSLNGRSLLSSYAEQLRSNRSRVS